MSFDLSSFSELVNEGVFTLPLIVEKYAHNPARIFNIERRGFIRRGYKADLVLLDDDCEPYTITDESVVSRCGWTPFQGLEINVRVDMTWVNGVPVFRHGVIFSGVKGEPLTYGRPAGQNADAMRRQA